MLGGTSMLRLASGVTKLDHSGAESSEPGPSPRMSSTRYSRTGAHASTKASHNTLTVELLPTYLTSSPDLSSREIHLGVGGAQQSRALVDEKTALWPAQFVARTVAKYGSPHRRREVSHE
eukprot:3871158-Prymnesium_polylepis.2